METAPPPPPSQPLEINPSPEATVNQHPPKKSFLFWFILGLFFLVVLLVGLTAYLLSTQKKSLKTQVEEQVDNLTQLQGKYGLIVEEIKRTDEPKIEDRPTQLLKVDYVQETPEQNQSTLEDRPEVQKMRRLSEFYRESQTLNDDIEKLNLQVKSKSQALPLSFFLLSGKSVILETETFNQKTKKLLEYLDQMNRLDIKATTLGFDIGVAIMEAIDTEASVETVAKLEDKIKQLEEIKKDYVSLSLEGLDNDVIASHQKGLEEFNEVEGTFDKILTDFRNKDGYSLVNDLKSVFLSAETETEKGRVEAVSFWQENETIRSVESRKKDWETWQKSFNKIPF